MPRRVTTPRKIDCRIVAEAGESNRYRYAVTVSNRAEYGRASTLYAIRVGLRATKRATTGGARFP